MITLRHDQRTVHLVWNPRHDDNVTWNLYRDTDKKYIMQWVTNHIDLPMASPCVAAVGQLQHFFTITPQYDHRAKNYVSSLRNDLRRISKIMYIVFSWVNYIVHTHLLSDTTDTTEDILSVYVPFSLSSIEQCINRFFPHITVADVEPSRADVEPSRADVVDVERWPHQVQTPSPSTHTPSPQSCQDDQ